MHASLGSDVPEKRTDKSVSYTDDPQQFHWQTHWRGLLQLPSAVRLTIRHVQVQNIVIWHERMNKTVDEICAEHDLTLADVYAALAYYFDHRDEIEHSIEESEAVVEALRRRLPSILEKKLKALRSE